MSILVLIVYILLFGVLGMAIRWFLVKWGVEATIINIVLCVFGLLIVLWLISALGLGDAFVVNLRS